MQCSYANCVVSNPKRHYRTNHSERYYAQLVKFQILKGIIGHHFSDKRMT